jgi:rare lipoprotein A
MQTKLRIVLFAFVAGLTSTSAMAAAPTTQVKSPVKSGKAGASQHHKAPIQHTVRYVGIASWYGKQHQGRKMANGKPFNRKDLTAANWNLPLGTMVRVVNLKNGNSVNVTITDRGPNHRLQRLIDLSEAAAEQLDYVQDGVAPVVMIPVPSPKFESAPITAELVEPPALSPEMIYSSAPTAQVQTASFSAAE